MSNNPNEQAPIFVAYMHIMEQWLLEMNGWSEAWLQSGNQQLKIGPFQSSMFYPFHSGKILGSPTDIDDPLRRSITEFAEKKVPFYGKRGSLYTVADYANDRKLSTFLGKMGTAKSKIRDVENGFADIWLDAIKYSIPWNEDYAENAQIFIKSYMDLLERICLHDAAEAIKDNARGISPEFSYIVTQAGYFSDIFFQVGRLYALCPKSGRPALIDNAVEVTEDLMTDSIESLQKLVDRILTVYQKDTPAELAEIISSRKIDIEKQLNQTYAIQRSLIVEDMVSVANEFVGSDTDNPISLDMYFLYLQYLAIENAEWTPKKKKENKSSPNNDDKQEPPARIEIDLTLETEYCAAMSRAFEKLKVFKSYYEVLCKAAALLYFGVYFHFSNGNRTIYADAEVAEIDSSDGYYVPLGLPLSMEKLRKFMNTHRSCLICGGGGSGKSTYLEKLIELDAKGTKAFSMVMHVPLRYLISDSTEQGTAAVPTLDSSLIWQKVRQVVQGENSAEGKKRLPRIERDLDKRGSGTPPVLLLLDGYNEILSIQNDAAILRLQNDIKWLSSRENIRIIMTYRAEDRLLDSELNSFTGWFFASPEKKEDTFYITYDAEKMMEIIQKSCSVKDTSDRFITLLKTRPMYLNALQYLDDPKHATQYFLLDSIYKQRYTATLNSPLVRDGHRSLWLALYAIILPELAYHMVVAGTQAIDRLTLHKKLHEILDTHRENLGNYFWWQCEETCRETASYPFKNADCEKDVDWIERALLNSDRILDNSDNHAIAFFHEDIRNYLAARHIAQRFSLYCRCTEEECCYQLPIRWEKLPKDMVPMVYEALGHTSGFEANEEPEKSVPHLLSNLILPEATDLILPYFLSPGNLMRFMLASQIQEYEYKNRDQLTDAFAVCARPLADYCLNPDQDLMDLPKEARAILSRVLYRMSGIERLDRAKPVPHTSFNYAKKAVALATDIYPDKGEDSVWKIAQHYLAKALLGQAQYLWTRSDPTHWPEADDLFLQSYALLKICSEEDKDYGVGLNLSLNLLGLWEYSPAPILKRRPVFQEQIGQINYAASFLSFFNSVKYAPAKSSNRPYAAMKCVAMLLEQQVFLGSSLKFSSLNELAARIRRNPLEVMTAETAGHGALALSNPALTNNILAAKLFLDETVGFTNEPHNYYLGLFSLYYEAQGKGDQNAYITMATREFRNEKKNQMKDNLCLAYIKAIHNKIKKDWPIAVESFITATKQEFESISPDDLGETDSGHKSNNQNAYQNLLTMLVAEIELRFQE